MQLPAESGSGPSKVQGGPARPLHGRAATRLLEHQAASALPDNQLMQRAGLVVARLALAVAPHARTVWIACGPGNNGGDGIEAAVHLKSWGKHVVLTWLGDPSRAPQDARAAWQRASAAGIADLANEAPPLARTDLCIDALLGVGATRAPETVMARCIAQMNASAAPILAIDLPSGLNADTGMVLGRFDTQARRASDQQIWADWTLSLLTLKPGLFTGHGRDLVGELWFDDLGVTATGVTADAMLGAMPAARQRLHASHKGSHGDLVVLGGATGMGGAAVLAASAGLSMGAGRVYLSMLEPPEFGFVPGWPELMLRPFDTLDIRTATLVCGCGGGAAVALVLPRVFAEARQLVLDADGLNAVSRDSMLRTLLLHRTGRKAHAGTLVLTPHPLEAARLLETDAASVQADRLHAARELAERFEGVVVLKGSGSVIAMPGRPPVINPTGSARLASAGTGDVLAGMIGALLASGLTAFDAACQAVYIHGLLADRWPADQPLTAGALARAASASWPR